VKLAAFEAQGRPRWQRFLFDWIPGGSNTNNRSTVQGIGALKIILPGLTRVAAGHYHSLALRSDGTVWA